MINTVTLNAELAQFTGTEQYYFNPLFRSFRYTEGVKFLAENAGAYWLLDMIFANQTDSKFSSEPFQVWTIELLKYGAARITVSDGSEQKLKSFKLVYTDFPLESFTIWLVDNVLMLRSEY